MMKWMLKKEVEKMMKWMVTQAMKSMDDGDGNGRFFFKKIEEFPPHKTKRSKILDIPMLYTMSGYL